MARSQPRPEISVIVPTIRGAEAIRPTLDALERQDLESGRFEVIVILDGADDGRAAAITEVARPYRLVVGGSDGRGRATACETGVAAARGALLLFLDDDMLASPDLLTVLLDRHTAGGVAVMAAVPVILGDHPSVATSFIGRRFERHMRKLGRLGYRITPRDVYTGAFSIERADYEAVGGFDRRFETYGNEDGDFAGRLQRGGVDIVFEPRAVAQQGYTKSFRALVEDNVAKGRTAVQFLRDHPERSDESAIRVRPTGGRRARLLRRLFAAAARDDGRRAGLTDGVERVASRVRILRPTLADALVERYLDACFWVGVRSAARADGSRDRPTVVQYTDSTALGGAEGVALTLLDGLDRSRWRPILLVHDEAAAISDEARRRDITVRETHAATGLGFRAVVRLARDLRRLRPAIVHVHRSWARSGNGAVIAARLAGARVVATEHLFLPTTPRRTILLRQLLDRLVERTIVVSDALRATMVGRFGMDPDRVEVIPNGIEAPGKPSAAAVAAIRDELGLTGHVVLVPARLEPQKGHPIVLEALGAMPDVTALFAGDGSRRSQLAELASHLGVGDRVRFLGHRSDVPALMLASDVVVLPSAAEGLPLAVLEAASLGRPVVATAVGGTPELITDGTTGRLVPPGDVDALRAAVSDVLCDPVAARRMAGRAKREVRARFTAQAMVDRTDAVYQAILGPARSSRSTRSERSKLASSADRAGDQLFLTGRDRFGTAAVFSGTWPGLDARADRLLVGEDLEGHGRAADVALAQDPRPEVIGRMHALLADDGVALATGGRPSRLVRRFHAAGFTGSRPFVAWPRGEAPRAFIPIDDPAAVRRVLGPRRSGLRGWLGAARRRAWLIGRSVGRGRGIVVATQGGPPFADLEAWWWTAGLGTVPSKVSWTLLTGGRETRSKVVAVITPYDQDGPGIVVKWGRDAVAATGLIHAATTLDTLAASPVRDSVAHVVDRREDPGGVRIVESMLSGRPLAQVVDHGNHATLAMHAAEWLASLAQGRAAIGVQDWWVRAAGPIVDRFAADVPGEPDLLSATRQQLRAVGDLPMLIEHRDFAPWNILVDADDRLHPTDWESAVEGGLPVLDLWYLLTYLALAVEREPEARLAAIYPRLVDPTSRTGAVSQQALERYARLIDIDIAAAAPLRALTWMVHLPSEIARARRSSTPSTMTFARLWAHEAGMLPASQMDRMQGTRNLDTTRS